MLTICCQIEASCNSFLMEVLNLIKPEVIVGVGQYATSRVQKVVHLMNLPCTLTNIDNQDFASNANPSHFSSSPKVADRHSNAIHDAYLKIHAKLTQNIQDLEVQNNSSSIKVSPLSEMEMASDKLVKREITMSSLHHKDNNATSVCPKVITLMHPSPANATANRGWDTIALKQLKESGVLDFFKSEWFSDFF